MSDRVVDSIKENVLYEYCYGTIINCVLENFDTLDILFAQLCSTFEVLDDGEKECFSYAFMKYVDEILQYDLGEKYQTNIEYEQLPEYEIWKILISFMKNLTIS